MLRAASLRHARLLIRTSAPTTLKFLRHAPPASLRFQSSEPKPKEKTDLKLALERNDNLQRDWDAKILLYDELKPRTENPTPDSYLIDVREPDEVIQGMIPSAVNLPLSALAGALHLESGAFKAQYGFNKPKKAQEVIFYCRSGMRSTTASDVAKRNGYTNILNYKGSWLEWVEKENKKSA